MNALEVRNVTKRYEGFALERVSFTLPSGCVLGLVGENGAGKSTLIRLILNAAGRDEGEIRVLGTDNRVPEFADLKNDLGVVLDEACFPEVLTPARVGAVMRHTYRNWDEALFERYLRQFDLPRDKMFKDFSRGMKMKLSVAAALSHRPRLLLLDEATSGLDPLVRDEILDIFNDFTRDEGHSILISSHIIGDLEKICDYIAFLHRGKLILFDEKDRLSEQYAVVKVSDSEFARLPASAVKGYKKTTYGADVLMPRSAVPVGLPKTAAGLEDIFLLSARGAEKE